MKKILLPSFFLFAISLSILESAAASAIKLNVFHARNSKMRILPPPTITSFTPTTTGAGTLIKITGTNFTDATAVTFGGVPAASFTIVSPTTITASLASGGSGLVSVTTSLGTGILEGFTFVPTPVISAGSQTTFSLGGNVILTATPGTGYAYKWAKNGVEIAGATSSTYTATETGAYTVSITINSVTITSDAIGVSVIYALPVNNFAVTASGETCRANNNGKINITATLPKSYTATLVGNGLNLSKAFTSTLDFIDLKAATYTVCITVAGEVSYRQCFDIVITEPKDLAVFAVVDKSGNKINLALDGSDSYIIDLNGFVFKTEKNNLTLDLQSGDNLIKVSTNKLCQGTFEKHIRLFDTPIAYPNPAESVLNLSGLSPEKTNVEIRSVSGKLVYQQAFNNETGNITISLENISPGIYTIKTSSKGLETINKIIKK